MAGSFNNTKWKDVIMLIGLSGKMGTGKSTIAQHLIKTREQMGKQVRIFKCAGPLYHLQDMIYSYLGLTLEGEKDRPLLIALGMWGREKDKDIWARKAVSEALEFSKSGGIAIIDDIRFDNEATMVQDQGILIRIEGEQRGPNLNPELMSSATETALDAFTFKNIINNKISVQNSIEQLEEILFMEG